MNKSNLTPSSGDAVFDAAVQAMTGQTLDPVTGEVGAPKVLNFRDLLLDMTRPVAPPEWLLEINGVPMLPLGGITTVAGKRKSGKSQFLAAMVATLLSGRDFGTMRRRRATGRILWVDTEQSEYDLTSTIARVYKQAGIATGDPSDAHDLDILPLRDFSCAERRTLVEQAVEALHPSLLIIDGIRDLLKDFNDITESQDLISWLIGALARNPSLRIAVVLHVNPGGIEKMRGHLGTELENKFSDRFYIAKENGVFRVTHESRGREMLMPFVFCIDGEGNLATGVSTNATIGEALQQVAPEGDKFDSIVRQVAALTSSTQRATKDALIARMNAKPRPMPNLDKRDDGLFYLVDE